MKYNNKVNIKEEKTKNKIGQRKQHTTEIKSIGKESCSWIWWVGVGGKVESYRQKWLNGNDHRII